MPKPDHKHCDRTAQLLLQTFRSVHSIKNASREKITKVIGPMKSFSVYPNPATNKLTVNVGEFIVEKMAVFDIQGQKVYADNDPYTGEKTINISFEKGVIF